MKGSISLRLNKYISNNTEYSRRKADSLIAAGEVQINGVIVTEPYINVVPDSIVILSGKVIKQVKKLYYIFYKPTGYISTRFDPHSEKNIYSILPPKMQKLKYAGRLDKNSEGLMILSNDGDFINKLQHPKNKIEREYIVTISTNLSVKTIFRIGIRTSVKINKIIYNYKIKRIKSIHRYLYKINIILTEGKNREIREIMRFHKIKIIKLKRVRIGTITLRDLKPGKFIGISPIDTLGI